MGHISWGKLILLGFRSIVLPSDASIVKDGNSTIRVSIDPASWAEISFATTNLAYPAFRATKLAPKKRAVAALAGRPRLKKD